jgi:hypothetical protein
MQRGTSVLSDLGAGFSHCFRLCGLFRLLRRRPGIDTRGYYRRQILTPGYGFIPGEYQQGRADNDHQKHADRYCD